MIQVFRPVLILQGLEITIVIKWGRNLQPGPVGEYIEVIDADRASGVFYKPVDLSDPRILARMVWLLPDPIPQFHQQIVYAAAMTTYRAL